MSLLYFHYIFKVHIKISPYFYSVAHLIRTSSANICSLSQRTNTTCPSSYYTKSRSFVWNSVTLFKRGRIHSMFNGLHCYIDSAFMFSLKKMTVEFLPQFFFCKSAVFSGIFFFMFVSALMSFIRYYLTLEACRRTCTKAEVCVEDIQCICCVFVHKILQLASPSGSRGHLTVRGRVSQLCVAESDVTRSWKCVSIIPTESVMVTDDPGGKPSANSKLYALPLKIAIGGMKFPTCFLQAKILISYPFPQKFVSTRLYFFSRRTLLLSVYIGAQPK